MKKNVKSGLFVILFLLIIPIVIITVFAGIRISARFSYPIASSSGIDEIFTLSLGE